MTLEYVYGDILESHAAALVNPVNCEGVMGKGLARQFKERYPKMFAEYHDLCKRHWFNPGQLFLYRVPAPPPRYIMCVSTKGSWRAPSTARFVQECAFAIYNTMIKYEIPSLAVPALGCGEGQLSWAVVQDILYSTLRPLRADVYIYPPHTKETERAGHRQHRQQPETELLFT